MEWTTSAGSNGGSGKDEKRGVLVPSLALVLAPAPELVSRVRGTATSTSPTGLPAAPTWHRRIPAGGQKDCDCLVKLSGFCQDIQRLAGPQGLTPELVWARTMKEVKEAAGPTATAGMKWSLESITNSKQVLTLQSERDSEPESRELKSLPQALPKAMPQAKSALFTESDLSVAHGNCKVSRKRKRKEP